MYKIAVFGDIHSNLQALEAIINDIDSKHYDKVICLGDIFSKGPNPKECIDLVMSHPEIANVWGNYEGKAKEIYVGLADIRKGERENSNMLWSMNQFEKPEKKFIMAMPHVLDLRIEGHHIKFLHYPYDRDTRRLHKYTPLTKEIVDHYFKDYEADYFFIGHRHEGDFYQDDKRTIYNIESSGCREDDNTFYYEVTITDRGINVEKINLKYDREKFEEALKKSTSPYIEHMADQFFGYKF